MNDSGILCNLCCLNWLKGLCISFDFYLRVLIKQINKGEQTIYRQKERKNQSKAKQQRKQRIRNRPTECVKTPTNLKHFACIWFCFFSTNFVLYFKFNPYIILNTSTVSDYSNPTKCSVWFPLYLLYSEIQKRTALFFNPQYKNTTRIIFAIVFCSCSV